MSLEARPAMVAPRALALALLQFPLRAWGWGGDGHRIVAIVAADNLTQAAQSHVANTYDTMAPQNRVVFPSRGAAEQAGYRAAYNCP